MWVMKVSGAVYLAYLGARSLVADIPIAALLLGVLAVLASTLSGWEGPPLPASLAGVGLGLLALQQSEQGGFIGHG